MNNSQLAQESVGLNLEEPKDITPKLREEESRLTRILEAVREIQGTKAWSSLREEIFDNLVNLLEKDLGNEARKEDCDPKRLNRLAGELKWAEKFSDLSKLENEYRVRLQGVRQQLYGRHE